MLNNEFAISTISSVISYGLTYPIDAVKTNFQVTNLKQKPVLNDVIKKIYTDHGFRGFYRGIGSTMMTYPLFWGIFFQTKSYSNVLIASSVASLVTNPLFVLKTRFQVPETNTQSYVNLTKTIYRTEGLVGFFKGFGATLANNTKLWIQIPLCDALSDRTKNIALSSMIAKITSSTLYYPIDIVRTNQRNSKDNRNMIEVAKSIYRVNSVKGIGHGVMGFYNGVGLYNLVSVPSFVALMLCRDYIKRFYNEPAVNKTAGLNAMLKQ